jgi:hypothetical protein
LPLVHLPWSSRVLLATSAFRVVITIGLPAPTAFRPWRSSRLRRFSPRLTLRVYFTPQPLPGLLLQGSSFRTPDNISSMPSPLRAGFIFVAATQLPKLRHVRSCRLQGLDACTSPSQSKRGLAAHTARALLGVALRQVSPSSSSGLAPFRSSPYRVSVTVIHPTGVQRVEIKKPDRSLPRPADLLEVLDLSARTYVHTN